MGMNTFNMHGTFNLQLPDFMETHYKKENEELSQYFVARYHPKDEDWEHFAGAEQSVGLTRQFKGGHEGVDYSIPKLQEMILKKMELVTLQAQMALMQATGGLLKSFILDPADDCPNIYHAEKDHIIVITERARDYSNVSAHLEINDGTSYEFTIIDNREVTSDQKKKYVCELLDSIRIGTSSKSGSSTTSNSIRRRKNSKSAETKSYFEVEGSTLLSYKGQESVITIPDGITEIKSKVFYKKDFITEVLLPDSLIKIGDWAFGYCSNLKSISIPDTVQSIGNQSFANCKALEYVDFPENLDYLGHHAFDSCGKLKEAVIKGSIKAIEEESFKYCSSLQSVHIPDSVIKIGPSAFYKCKDLKQIDIGNGLERINNFAFTSCEKLKNIVFPESLKEIGMKSFLDCGLTSIILPKSLRKLGEMCFASCKNLSSVEFCSPIKKITQESFSQCGLTKMKLPEGVQSIEKYAFSGRFSTSLNQLRKIFIPGTVSEIDDWAFGPNPELAIYCPEGSYAEEFASKHSYQIVTDPTAIAADFPKKQIEISATQQSSAPPKKTTANKRKNAAKSSKKPEDCPIPKDFKDHTTITDNDFTPDSTLAQSAVCYVLETLSKMDLRFSTVKSNHKIGNDLFVNLVNVGSYQEYQETVCRAINNDPFPKALLIYTIRDFLATVRQSDNSDRQQVTASYCGLFIDMLRFLYTNDRISDTEHLLRGMGTLGIRYRNVIINEITVFSKKQSQTPESRLQAAREWLTKICQQPDIRILSSDKKLNPLMFLQLLCEDALHFQDSDFDWDEEKQKHEIHGIQANEEVLWSFPELFFMWYDMPTLVVKYLNNIEKSQTVLTRKDMKRPRPWDEIGAWTPFALFYAATQDQIAVSFTEDKQVYLCFTELLKPFEQNLKQIISEDTFSGRMIINIVPTRRDVITHKLEWGLSVSDNGFCSGKNLLDKTQNVLVDYNKTYERIIAYAWPSPKIESQTTIGFFGLGGFMGSGGLCYKSFSTVDYKHEDNEYYDVPTKSMQDKLEQLLNHTTDFSEEKRALHYARLFRVSKTSFDPRSDRECEVRNGYMKEKVQLRAFRSFIWCLACYLNDQGRSFSEVSSADVQKVLETIKEGTNYQEDSYFPELCGLPENFSVYTDINIPEYRIVSAFLSLEESENNTINCLGSLSDLRNEIRLLIPAMDLIYADLKSKRDFDQPLEGTAADILNCWCVIALAADSNVVLSTTGRLGMYWDQFDDNDDFRDSRKPSEIISGIQVPWMTGNTNNKNIPKEEFKAAVDLIGSINVLQSKLAEAADTASNAEKIVKDFKTLQEEADKRDAEKEKKTQEIAAEACKNGRDLAWLYFIIRNEWTLGTLNCSDDEFWTENRKYFPEMLRETLLLRRQQAMPWLNDPNTYINQFKMLFGTDFEQRYTMLVRHFMDRIAPVDPWQHTNKAFGWLRNFFRQEEQQILWSRLCREINEEKTNKLQQLSALNPDFSDFQRAKHYLVIRLEDPDPAKYDRSNPYNYLGPEAYITIGLFDQSKMGMFINLISSQAWIWNTTLDEIYRAAVPNVQDERSIKSDGKELIRRLLPQYLY